MAAKLDLFFGKQRNQISDLRRFNKIKVFFCEQSDSKNRRFLNMAAIGEYFDHHLPMILDVLSKPVDTGNIAARQDGIK